jgi:hypothetical protein
MEAQGNERIKPYTASVKRNIESLSRIGLSPEEISSAINAPLFFVQRQMARIQRENEARRKFLRTGRIPELENPGVFTIFQ